MDFLDRFSPQEMREKKFVELMKLHLRKMSMKEYSQNFTQHSKYAPTMVDNSRATMNKFVIGVSSLVEEMCRIVMLHNDMDL